jgi:hypothetical protein
VSLWGFVHTFERQTEWVKEKREKGKKQKENGQEKEGGVTEKEICRKKESENERNYVVFQKNLKKEVV